MAEACGHKVDAFSGAACEDYLVGATGIDESAHGVAGGFVEVGGFLGKEMDTAVDVGICVVVFVRHGFNHLSGLLGCGGVVEVNKRAAVDLAAEDGEVGTDFFYIIHYYC